jgi:hypothetical protein
MFDFVADLLGVGDGGACVEVDVQALRKRAPPITTTTTVAGSFNDTDDPPVGSLFP